MAAFIEGLAKMFISDSFKGAEEKLEDQSTPDVELNSVAPLSCNDENSHDLCSSKRMEEAFESQAIQGCVPTAPPLSVDSSSSEINEHFVKQSLSLGEHETIHALSLSASLKSLVSKETERRLSSDSSSVLNTTDISRSPKFPIRVVVICVFLLHCAVVGKLKKFTLAGLMLVQK